MGRTATIREAFDDFIEDKEYQGSQTGDAALLLGQLGALPAGHGHCVAGRADASDHPRLAPGAQGPQSEHAGDLRPLPSSHHEVAREAGLRRRESDDAPPEADVKRRVKRKVKRKVKRTQIETLSREHMQTILERCRRGRTSRRDAAPFTLLLDVR